ncbi:2-keto-4-pentenoate hydratase [Enterococcus sp. LJL90]
MNEERFAKIVAEILAAQLIPQEIPKLTESLAVDLTVAEAYQIQKAVLEKRISKGEKVKGLKMGLTSRAKMQQMQVDQPVYGKLLDSMVSSDGGSIALSNFLHPKVEAEIGFVFKHDLFGGDLTISEVMAATDYIFPALEIIDSRYKDFNFTIPDVIADNTSAAGVIFSNNSRKLTTQDLATIGVVLEINGQVRETGAGAAVLEHPVQAIIELAELLAKEKQILPAGLPILTGSITQAVTLQAGDYVTATFGEDLGSVRLFVK